MGEFSILTIKLFFLFLPGIIFCIFYERWNLCSKKEFNMFIINSFIWGVVSYSIYYLIIKKLSITQEIFFINDLLNINEANLHYNEILWSCLIAFILVYAISYLKNHNCKKELLKYSFINKIYNKIRPTFVEESLCVWAHVFGDKKSYDNSGWVKIHNIKENIIYYGFVQNYSDNINDNELYISDVQVLSEDEKIIKEIDALYVGKKSNDIIIEFVKDKGTAKEEDNDRQTRTKQTKTTSKQ